MYRRSSKRDSSRGKCITTRKPQYKYSNDQFPAFGIHMHVPSKSNWEHIVAKDEQSDTVVVEDNIYDNIDILEAEEMIYELEERDEIYKREDDMRYGINRMTEWDRGYYKGNPYLYSWEYNKMDKFTEDLEGDMEDELD